MLSRWNMVDQKLTVSRGQAMIRCTADGIAILSSEGESPTLWRSNGGQWDPLYKGQEHYLNEGDQVSLDCNDPEGAVFMCNVDRSGQQQQQVTDPTGGQMLYLQALSDYYPQQEGELGFRAGEYIQVTQSNPWPNPSRTRPWPWPSPNPHDHIQVMQQGEPGGWWEGTLNGQTGWFPSSYCIEQA